jgi:hypothetical protein
MMQDQSQCENTMIYPSSEPPETNNPASNIIILLCDFSLIISVALNRLWVATFIVWRTAS